MKRYGEHYVNMKANIEGDVSAKQEISKITRKPPEAKREAWNRFSLTAPRRNQTCQHLGLEFLPSRTVRQ